MATTVLKKVARKRSTSSKSVGYAATPPTPPTPSKSVPKTRPKRRPKKSVVRNALWWSNRYGSYRMTPMLRNYLAAWPDGELRSVARVRRDTGHKGDLFWMGCYHYVANGSDKAADHWSIDWCNDKQLLKRTARPVSPFKGKKKPGLFPWDLDTHWTQIVESPAHVAREVSTRLRGVDTPDLHLKLACPIHIEGLGMLKRARQLLVMTLGGEDPSWTPGTKRHLQSRFELGLVNPPLLTLLSSAHGIRALCLELLVTPEFGPDGALVRFVALDPEDAAEQLEQLYGEGTPLERYRAVYAA